MVIWLAPTRHLMMARTWYRQHLNLATAETPGKNAFGSVTSFDDLSLFLILVATRGVSIKPQIGLGTATSPRSSIGHIGESSIPGYHLIWGDFRVARRSRARLT